LNQNSLFGLDLEKVFFALGLKIVLQHYRPNSDIANVRNLVAMGWKADIELKLLPRRAVIGRKAACRIADPSPSNSGRSIA